MIFYYIIGKFYNASLRVGSTFDLTNLTYFTFLNNSVDDGQIFINNKISNPNKTSNLPTSNKLYKYFFYSKILIRKLILNSKSLIIDSAFNLTNSNLNSNNSINVKVIANTSYSNKATNIQPNKL